MDVARIRSTGVAPQRMGSATPYGKEPTGGDPPRCGAKLRKKDATCRAVMLLPSGRCRLHGGKSLRGTASATFKDGRRSKYLPIGIVSAYRDALADPALLELRDEIALLDARIAELLAAMKVGEPAGDWGAVKRTWLGLRAAQQRGDAERAREIVADLERLVLEGEQASGRWQEVYRALRDRRRLVESERRRLVESQQVMTLERVGVLMEVLSNAVFRHVRDRETLRAINAEWNEILDGGQKALPPGS